MTKLEELEQKIYDAEIEIIETDKINDKSAILKDFKGEYPTVIVVNKKKIENKQDYVVQLSHELGHYNTAGYYHPFMLKSYKRKTEYNANVDSVKRLIPIKKLRKLLQCGYLSRFEIAEEFCVPEYFIDEAIHIYKRKGLLPGW
jgi:Zn-dependent peptidase ImmA (M78 family)